MAESSKGSLSAYSSSAIEINFFIRSLTLSWSFTREEAICGVIKSFLISSLMDSLTECIDSLAFFFCSGREVRDQVILESFADLAEWDLLLENVLPDCLGAHFALALCAGCRCEGSVTLHHPLYPDHLLQGVNVLGVVAQEFALFLQGADEPVAGAGTELAGVDLAGELEEGAGVLAEVMDVEHGLGVGQVGEVDGEAGVNSIS